MYNQLAEDDKVRYKNEMNTWEEHMVEIGRQDLIRKKNRTTKTPATKAGKKTAKSKVTKSKTAATKKAVAVKKKTITKVIKKTTRNTKKA